MNVETGDAVVPMAEPVMESALRHLLLNAAQAMNGQGAILIAVQQNGDACSISIRDSGPGIAPNVRACHRKRAGAGTTVVVKLPAQSH